jgi:hypothetical protein
VGYVDKSDSIESSYGITRRTWEVDKKAVFYLLDLSVPNAFHNTKRFIAVK